LVTVGRPERAIDPGEGPAAEFASQLRELRATAGRPSYRELARRSGVSVTVLSQAAGGRCLPTLAVVRSYVRACGGDVAQWEERWRVASARQREIPDGSAPYLGLTSYTQEQADLFFGRERLTALLLEQLSTRRFLAVFGPSGSGKSSLLRAGLLAAVGRADQELGGQWVTALLTPGDEPMTRLAGQLASLSQTLATRPAGTEMLLVVDQFEEVFSAQDPRQQDGFVDALLTAVTTRGSRLRVVLGVRADFYAQCARWPDLVRALSGAQVLVGPMDQDELRDVICKPAQRAGMVVERGLIAAALAETGTEPGALPLVSHALLETWRHSPPGRLTLSAYTEAGGVRHAIASTAERVYLACDDAQRQSLRRLFLRLIALGDGGPDTRRRATPDELASGADAGSVAAALEEAVRARLVTIDDGAAQLAHEALIRSWPRLSGWLADGRDGLRVQRRLEGAAAEWERLGRDPATLYRGAQLAIARDWTHKDAGLTGLTRLERDFLAASDASEAAEHAAKVRGTRRLRRLVVALVAALIAVSTAGGIAAWQRATAVSADHAATSGQLAAQSAALAPTYSDAAVLAALAAWRQAPTVAARSALLSTTACCMSAQTTMHGVYADVDAVALSAGAKLLAAGGADKAVHLWDTGSGQQIAVLRGPGTAVDALAFSPTAPVLAAGSADHTIWLWNLRGRPAASRVLTGDAGAITDLAFSPGGTLLAAASADGTIRLWNPATGRLAGVLRGGGAPMRSVAFSPDGTMLAGADGDTVTVWNITHLAHLTIAWHLTGKKRAIVALAYGRGPLGSMIAAEGRGGGIVLWYLDRRTHVRLLAPGSHRGVQGLAFSRDGTVLIAPGAYYEMRLWDTATGRLAATRTYRVPGNFPAFAYDQETGSAALGGAAGAVQFWQQVIPPFTGSSAAVTGLIVIPGSDMIASVSDDRTLRLWNRQGDLIATMRPRARPTAIAVRRDGRLIAVASADGTVTVFGFPGLRTVLSKRLPGPVTDVAFSADGRMLAVSRGTAVTAWDTGTWKPRLSLRSRWGSVRAVAFGAGGHIAAATSGGNVVVWDSRSGRLLASARVAPAPLNAVAFSPDGRFLATGASDGYLVLRDAGTLRPLGNFGGPGGSVWAIAFSPDGKTLAAGMSDGTIMLWNRASLTPAGTLTSLQGTVRTLAFTPDGTALFSGHNSNAIIAWNLNPETVARRDCQLLAGDPDLIQARSRVPAASYPRVCDTS
jgi:WD40 repeat protein